MSGSQTPLNFQVVTQELKKDGWMLRKKIISPLVREILWLFHKSCYCGLLVDCKGNILCHLKLTENQFEKECNDMRHAEYSPPDTDITEQAKLLLLMSDMNY